ncbi:protein FAM200B-like [Hydra vulgaris]|uniref:Protein FAM200B-like n=1 Tax=Hydra vulgaris TaxID=6087 RepID=A0ABM4DC78_HYDVU
MSSASKKKIWQYSEEYLKFGFIPAVHDARLPFCLLCQQCLSNELMKPGRLEARLKAKHKDQISSNLNYFQILKKNFEKRATLKSLFTSLNVNINCTLEASYQISLLIAKSGKKHTTGEQLIKPSISTFVKTVFGKDDRDSKIIPLCNNTVSRRIDELSEDVGLQLIEKLKTRLFSVQMDESTLRDSEAVLLTYVRYIDNNDFAEEMLFCKSLKSSITAKDIYSTLKSYLDTNKIPMKNITSCAADGAPNMMGKKNGCLKLMKDENLMLLVHCVIHRENLVAKNLPPILYKIMNLVVKCVNSIKVQDKSAFLNYFVKKTMKSI